MRLTKEDRAVVEKLQQLAREHRIDIAGGKMRRTSSRFCLGVEHGDYNGTELFGVGTDRFIWMAYKPKGTNKVQLFTGNLPNDGAIEYAIGNVPKPKSPEITETWGRFPYRIDYILQREGFTLKQGIDRVLFGNIPGSGMSRSASLCINLIPSLLDGNGIDVKQKVPIVDLAQAVENDHIGSPCGKLDQTMVLLGEQMLGGGDKGASGAPVKADSIETSKKAVAVGCVRSRPDPVGIGASALSPKEARPSAVRLGFMEFAPEYLKSPSDPSSMARREAHHCANEKRWKSSPDESAAPTTPAITAVKQVDANTGHRRITAERLIKEKEAEGKYDVLFSYNSKDEGEVEEIGRKLKAIGIRPWLDKWDIVPGETVMEAIEEAIRTIKCAVLFFGPADVGRWHIMEIRAYVESKAGREARFIPAILPGVETIPELPVFVSQSLWVDMRDWKEPRSDAFGRLVCGILRRRPGDSPRVWNARHVLECQSAGGC
jgi:hypothetical protein